MAEKKEPKVLLSGKEYSLNDYFPSELLKKNYSGNEYIPIDVIRDIMRRIGGFSSPKFSDLEVIGKSVYKWNDVITYKQKVELVYNDKTLYWEAYHPITAGKLFSDSSTGVFSTLRSKCLRDALKYEFKIFEYPSLEEEDVLWEKDNKDAKKIWAGEVNTTKKEVVDKKKEEKSERFSQIEVYNTDIWEMISDIEKDPSLKEDAKLLFSNMKEELKKMELTPEEKKVLLDNWNKLDALLK